MTTHKNSCMDVLSGLAVGVRVYAETTYQDAPNVMRRLKPPKSRRPVHMRPWVFKTELLTAVCAGNAGDVRYLICVTRMA